MLPETNLIWQMDFIIARAARHAVGNFFEDLRRAS
jgi:hypothetical protein